jgi:hypothetical protein
MLAKLEEIEGRVFKGMEETKSMIEQANASYAEWFRKVLRSEGR